MEIVGKAQKRKPFPHAKWLLMVLLVTSGCVAHVHVQPDASIVVTFAKEPYLEARWVEHLFTLGGGSTMEVALALLLQSCDGRQLWRQIATGYGSSDHLQAFANWPGTEEFQPAVDAALKELAHNLSDVLSEMPQPHG